MSLIAALLSLAVTKPMSEKEEKRWRSRRAGGCKAFIWKWGVLVFGGVMFIGLLLMLYLMGDVAIISDPRFLLFVLVICLLGGWFFGSIGWDAGEMRLANTLKNRGEEREPLSIWKSLASRRRYAKNRELHAVIEQTETRLGAVRSTSNSP